MTHDEEMDTKRSRNANIEEREKNELIRPEWLKSVEVLKRSGGAH